MVEDPCRYYDLRQSLDRHQKVPLFPLLCLGEWHELVAHQVALSLTALEFPSSIVT